MIRHAMHETHDEKNNVQQHWLSQYGMRLSYVFIAALFWVALYLTLSFFNVDHLADTKIGDPIRFLIRDALGRSPKMNSKLKVFAVDDQTFAKLGTPMPSIHIWAEVLDSITQKKPKVVIIDAMFSERQENISQRTKFWLDSVKSSKVPIVTGSFVSKDQIIFKHSFDLIGTKYQMQTYRDPQTKLTQAEWMASQIPEWIDRKGWHVFGPHASVTDFFNNIGHLRLFTDHRIEPFIRFGDETVLPYVSLFAADSVHFKSKKLVINGESIALDRRGEMPVNFMPDKARKIHALWHSVEDALNGSTNVYVDEGDVVVILPLYYTGNVDFRPSPYGMIPGGMYIVDSINSILNSDYLQPVIAETAFSVMLICLSVGIAYFVSASWSWIVWLGACFFCFGLSQILFSYLNLVVPFVSPIFIATLAGANVYALKVRSMERKSLALRSALDGAVAPEQLEKLVSKPDDINLEPRERVVTLMFIDIVGFSLSSESMAPRDAFIGLKLILSRISEIIHQHGGIIDKTLGDGLLCYFGYRFDSDVTDSNHPETALRCAIKIQEQMLEEAILAARSSAPIYPLRIGLNTASCYLGDLGSGRRIEFTVVGNGVNFAKRLEASCREFCVMIGATTHDLVKGLPWADGIFAHKIIKIKHHSGLRDAIEVDTLKSRATDLAFVMEAYHRQASFHRAADRIHVRAVGNIFANTAAGRGHVLDFNAHGASIVFDFPRARGDVFAVNFESCIPGLKAALESYHIRSIEVEVRWIHEAAEGSVHGVVFRNLDSDHNEVFVRLMSEFAFMAEKRGSEGRTVYGPQAS